MTQMSSLLSLALGLVFLVDVGVLLAAARIRARIERPSPPKWGILLGATIPIAGLGAGLVLFFTHGSLRIAISVALITVGAFVSLALARTEEQKQRT